MGRSCIMPSATPVHNDDIEDLFTLINAYKLDPNTTHEKGNIPIMELPSDRRVPFELKMKLTIRQIPRYSTYASRNTIQINATMKNFNNNFSP